MYEKQFTNPHILGQKYCIFLISSKCINLYKLKPHYLGKIIKVWHVKITIINNNFFQKCCFYPKWYFYGCSGNSSTIFMGHKFLLVHSTIRFLIKRIVFSCSFLFYRNCYNSFESCSSLFHEIQHNLMVLVTRMQFA